MSNTVKYELNEDRMPRQWYNLAADLPEPLAPPLAPGHPGADRPGGAGTAVPHGADRPGGQHRAPYRHPRRGPRHLPAMAADAPVPRPPAGAAPRYPGAHLLQIRGRQPGRQPQAQYRRAAGLLQQAGRHQPHHHRDRGRPMGLVPGAGRGPVRHRGRCLHGQGQLSAEALPPRA